ncbi:MAG TPA: dihydrolipoamide acetyltransferase family protein [Ktedonobacteraceae bacterium]|nr:dihydrolipoamide acetyltransferase family protein [Ktedonobacteraceae bacterium]
MKTVEMPKMGDTMEEGKILRWIKHEGDQVKKGESLAEVETDKVNIEIESFASGVLRKILVPEGKSAPIGAGIALIGTADEALPAELAGNGAAGKKPETRVKEGNGTGYAAQTVPQQASVQAAPAVPGQERIFISPIARRVAEENQLDYQRIQGTGPNGRIIKMDVEAALAQRQAAVAPAPAPAAPAAPVVPSPVEVPVPEPAPVAVEAGEVVEIPLTTMRRTIARRLGQSWLASPHFFVTSIIDTGKLADLRRQINEYAEKDPAPVKVSFNDLIVKAVALALLRMPQVNVSFAEDKLLQKKQVHIGMAVALEQGLIVPVIHDADKRGILDIARESHRLAEAARTGKLHPEDLTGGTFTISNLGMFDVDSFTAVINPPESAILAVGSITPTPVVVDGQVVVRDRMKVTLSSDHRALDGAIAARFLQEVKRLLEEPFGLLL